MLAIVDCGMGNLQSVVRAFQRVGAAPTIVATAAALERAERIVLPGVGSLAHGMESLRARALLPVLHERVVVRATPVLGICVGHQMLCDESEEGPATGLGWIAGRVRRLAEPGTAGGLKVPHLGWSEVQPIADDPLFAAVPPGACFYFAHSYAVVCEETSPVAATVDYGGVRVAALHADHVFGVQFHPEKSQAHGLRVLRNFLDYGR